MSIHPLLPDFTNAGNSGVYWIGPAEAKAARNAPDDRRWRVHPMDLSDVCCKHSLLALIAGELEFPDTFGRNWDALADCLGDLGWLPECHHVLLFLNADVFRKQRPEEYAILLDILEEACRFAADGRQGLFALLQTASEC